MATKVIAWNTGTGNITLTYQGQGNGTISVSSDENNLGSTRSQTITVKTTVGGLVTKNLTINQAACPFPVGDVKSYSYTGSYQEVELPAGQYKLQVWGAQGGSNGTNSSYGITAQAGGKGGYSEGIITLSQKTTVRVYVGGQGSSSAGGYNGGGSTSGTSQNEGSSEFGYTKMGGGGGGTDIRLSDGSLYSRMIVAGGGSGGAMSYRRVTTTSWTEIASGTATTSYSASGGLHGSRLDVSSLSVGEVIRVNATVSNTTGLNGNMIAFRNSSNKNIAVYEIPNGTYSSEYTVPANTAYTRIYSVINNTAPDNPGNFTYVVEKQTSSTSTSTDSHTGYVGGGTEGGGYSTSYKGKQNAAGTGGNFGHGANLDSATYRYSAGAGGGGWYGGGLGAGNVWSYSYCSRSGGGSGWVNTSASSGNRPSGYTGLQLDSGTTYAGDTSFPSTGGGTETGHSGNGYARITRLA